MKTKQNKFPRMVLLFAAMLTIGFYVGCKDDPPTPDPKPVASFQYTVDQQDFLLVTFTNFSQNAASYSWDFGDGNSSTLESPTHTYAAAGSYTVVLTATNSAGSANRSEDITLTDPDEALTMLAGATSKTWYMAREGVALGIGPGPNDNTWWSYGGVTPLGDRPCILDDQYIFHRDGTFEFNSNGTLWIDDQDCCGGWKVGEFCHDETEPDVWLSHNGEDLSAYANGGDYTYVFDNANSTLTLSGLGAYIGLANKTEEGDNYLPVSTKTYTIFNFAAGAIADSLQMALVGAGQSWNFYLVSYHNPADLPDIPTSQPKADFNFTKDGFNVTFENASANATSYMWDFGDGGMSTEENPVHTYAGEGEYSVRLQAFDDMSNVDEVTKMVVISAAEFSGAVLSNATGKVWRLNGAGSYKVGPVAGSGEWWGGPGEGERACQMDDEFIFSDAGSMVYDSKGQVYAEAYMLGPDGCVNDEDLTPPYDVCGSGSHMFVVTEAAGDDPARVTAIGNGAFIGFNKAFNGGELDGTIVPPAQITYDVFEYAVIGNTEFLTLVIDISADLSGTSWWTIILKSEN